MTQTKQICLWINAAHQSGDKEAIHREASKLAKMKVKSQTKGFESEAQAELIEDCLCAISGARFRGHNEAGEPATYSTFVHEIIYRTICKAVHLRKRIIRKRVVLDRNRLSESEWKLAFEVMNLRNNGATFKKIVKELRASGELPRKTDHVALRQRWHRWQAKATLIAELVEVSRGEVMAGWGPIPPESEWGSLPVYARSNRKPTLSEMDR